MLDVYVVKEHEPMYVGICDVWYLVKWGMAQNAFVRMVKRADHINLSLCGY